MSIACSGAKLGTGPKLFYVRILLSEGKAAEVPVEAKAEDLKSRRGGERKKEKRGLLPELADCFERDRHFFPSTGSFLSLIVH